MQRHRRRVYVRPRARLRVGLGPGLEGLGERTGHGTTWTSVLRALGREVRFTHRGVDVWLASGHEPPPEGRPLVVQVHEAAWIDPVTRGFLHPDFAGPIDAATRLAVGAAVAVITPSHAARAQVIEAYGAPDASVHAIPHGVDHDRFRPGLPGGRELVGAPYVLSVAVLHPRKNYAAVRRAVADLAAAGHPHRLAVVGNLAPDPRARTYEAEALAELPGAPGRLRAFHGCDEAALAALMAGADALCLPSHFEGFGLPVIEAMACGTPVVVSDRGALPEVVGDAALVCSPDPAEVSAAVARVVSDAALAASLRRAGVARAADFSWERTAAGWLEVLRAVA